MTKLEQNVQIMANTQVGELISITLGDMLDAQAARFPNVDAVVDPHKEIRFTYAQFRDECNLVARGMLALGIKKADHVAIWATNYVEWLLTMFATAKIGAVLVTVNTNYKRFELEYLMRQSDTMTLILMEGFKDSNYMHHLSEICPMLEKSEPGKLKSPLLPVLKNIIYLGKERKSGTFHWSDLYEQAKNVSEEERAALQASLDPHDVINMQYTSGTTGFPKGVMLTHFNILNNGKSIGDCMRFSHEDRLCITVPLFHCFGCVLGVMASTTHASSMILVEQFHPLKVMQAVTMEHCTALHGVPTMFISILNHPDFSKFNYSSLRTGIMAGSPCPIEIMRRVANEMSMTEITIVFGQTECSPGMTQSRIEDSLELRVSTVGRLLPQCEGMIINPETGLEVPPNTPGEIITRGYHVMKGYYNMGEATKQAIDAGGWLHTGDIGTVDENGYYKITGRLKDMIIRGGENIYPREIEEFLYTHPAVKDVQAVGVPDAKYGEEVMAFVILNDGASVEEEVLIRFVKEGLSRYKAPRYICFIESFPMTASGKIQKYILREKGIELLHLQSVLEIETA